LARTRRKKPTPGAVLVAEDEPTVRALAESIIGELGYATFSAANAREALALLEDGAPITLLFTDINMPDPPDGIDGLELARVAVERRPGLRVIYTTGGAQNVIEAQHRPQSESGSPTVSLQARHRGGRRPSMTKRLTRRRLVVICFSFQLILDMAMDHRLSGVVDFDGHQVFAGFQRS